MKGLDLVSIEGALDVDAGLAGEHTGGQFERFISSEKTPTPAPPNAMFRPMFMARGGLALARAATEHQKAPRCRPPLERRSMEAKP